MQYQILLNSYNKNGYIYEYRMNNNGDTKLDYQHRIKWELKTGIKIPKEYDIHHIDGNKTNNKTGKIIMLLLFGELVIISGNLMLIPSYLHSKIFHNIKNKI